MFYIVSTDKAMHMAELWFDHAEALWAACQTPKFRTSSEDKANFVDPANVVYIVTEEHVIVDPKTQAVTTKGVS